MFSIAPTAGGGIIGRAAIGSSPFHQTIYVLEKREEKRIDAEELIRLLLLGTYNIYIVAVGGGAAAIAPSWPGVKRWTWSMDPGEKS